MHELKYIFDGLLSVIKFVGGSGIVAIITVYLTNKHNEKMVSINSKFKVINELYATMKKLKLMKERNSSFEPLGEDKVEEFIYKYAVAEYLFTENDRNNVLKFNGFLREASKDHDINVELANSAFLTVEKYLFKY